MGDLVFIAVTIAFFALAAGLVKVCDHIIGPDDTAELSHDQAGQLEEVGP